ncbi:MAG: T9SS type A sorting domain-containing protein, partial [Crocinitomicaceae bacterium]|nr:T9SS type A sorting domain-containing protein [Crocinitomicaceae bacterium]
RMIDVTDKFNPLEIGMYANSSIESVAQSAYNNVVLIGNYAYVPVDYCGLDVVDISTPVMTNVNWINPWGCTTTNWDGCAGHTNQIVNVGDSLLFISGGDSEILVYDISDKANPVRIGEKIVLNNLEVSWGIDVHNQYIATAMVDNPFGIPYDSDWGGLQLWEWNETLLNNEEMRKGELVIFPNPADNKIFISNLTQGSFVMICDYSGRKIYEGIMEDDYINVFDFQSGLYFCTVYNGNELPQTCKFIIE